MGKNFNRIKITSTIGYLYIILVVFSIFNNCAREEKQAVDSFLVKADQSSTERIVLESFTPKEKLHLTDLFGIMNAGSMRTDNENIYILDSPPLNKIYVLDKLNLSHINTISPGIGRGPGELPAIGHFSLSGDYIILSNETHSKVQLRNVKGEFIEEFITDNYFPHRAVMWRNEVITILSPRSANSGSIFFNFDRQGKLLGTFGNVSDEEFNPIRFSGNILINDDDNYFYYKGYSEHILTKWDKNGNVIYSVTTVDDVPEEINYATFSGADQKVYQYSPTAIFSAVGLSLYNNLLAVVNRGDWNETPYIQYLDFYNTSDGQYVASVELPYIAGFVQLDNEYIYAIHRIDDDAHLVIYENNIQDLLNKDID